MKHNVRWVLFAMLFGAIAMDVIVLVSGNAYKFLPEDSFWYDFLSSTIWMLALIRDEICGSLGLKIVINGYVFYGICGAAIFGIPAAIWRLN